MFENAQTPDTESVSPWLAAALDQLAEGVIVADEQGRIVYVNAAAAAIHGVAGLGVGPDDYADSYHLFTMDGAPYPSEELPLARAVSAGETVKDSYWRIQRADGRSIVALGTAGPVYDGQGRQIGAVLTLRDETEREAERKALQSAVALKDMLLREIHHRVKNNLQLVSSMLSLQGRRTVDPATQAALGDLSARVDIIADIHRALYETGETDRIEVIGYLGRLTERHVLPLVESFGIQFDVAFSGACTLPIEKATSLALALNELVLNSLHHAFADVAEPRIRVEAGCEGDQLTVTYLDNGPGPDPIEGPGSLGLGQVLISGLERQLGARVDRRRTPAGFVTEIAVPIGQGRAAAS